MGDEAERCSKSLSVATGGPQANYGCLRWSTPFPVGHEPNTLFVSYVTQFTYIHNSPV